MPEIANSAIDPSVLASIGAGLGGAFVLALFTLGAFMILSKIDHGFLGLIFLLTMIFFLIAFSFLVAAATPGWSIKLSVAIVDAAVAISTKLLSKPFLDYLGS